VSFDAHRAARHPAYRAAMQMAQQKRYHDALKSFQQIAAAQSHADVGTLAHYQLGYCYLALKQKQQALAAFQRFVQFHPNTPLTAPAQAKIRQLTHAPTPHALPSTPHPARADCGPAALLVVCQRLGVTTTQEELMRLAGTDATGTTMMGLAQAAKAEGLKTEGLWVDAQAFQRLRLPALAWVNGNHWVAVFEVSRNTVTLFDPAKDKQETIGLSTFQSQWDGYLLRVWKSS
jgi:tetratricopeptide (TPR) repeat protein